MSLPYDPAEVAALAVQHNLPEDVLTKRLCEQHWDVFLALVLPNEASDKIVDLRFINLCGTAYYEVTWTDKPVTARDIIERFVSHHLPMYDLIGEQYNPYF